MQSDINGHYCSSCNHLMIAVNMASVLGENHLCPKSVTMVNCHLHQQRCPINSYTMGVDKASKQENISISNMESHEWSLYSEGLSYEETDNVYNDDSYNSLGDQQTFDTCRQCCTVGRDELVIPKFHNWSLSRRSNHTVICRYCREEVKNCYDHNLVRCVEHWRKGHSHQECGNYGLEETGKLIDCDFAVNCIPVEETTVRSHFNV